MKNAFFLLLLLGQSHNVFPQTSGYAENGGTKIFYRTFGSGEPILIINGGPGMNSEGFTLLAKKLAGHHTAILFDQRGTGNSKLASPGKSNVTMDLMVADMEALRKHLHIEKWILLGHSFGGMLASWYTTMYPQRVEKLILSSSGGIDLELNSYVTNHINERLSADELRALNYWNAKINGGDTTYHARLQRGLALAPAYVYNRKYIPVIAERLTQGNPIINGLVWSDMQKIGFDCSAKLRSYTGKVLIIQGKQDIIEEKTALKATRVFKNATLVLLDNCVHYGWLDSEQAYFSAIDTFMRS